MEEFVEEQQPSSEELESLEQKRSIMNNDAEKHRRLRDDLNKQTKEWIVKRDGLNAQVRTLVDEASKHRENRDELNVKVRESKDLRDEWNKKVAELNEKVSALRKDIEPAQDRRSEGEVPIKQLKKQLRELEFKQQTNPLGKDKENEIVKQISQLAKQIAEKEKASEQGGEVKELVYQLRESKSQAEVYHKAVSEYARAAQTAHDDMIALYEEADKLRKEADAAQLQFIECKTQADEEHKKHIEQIESVHKMDKDVVAIKSKKAKDRKKKVDNEFKKEAEEIFERFKAGEKLSTEDLMSLQKSGYL
ncbi:MAG: phosphoserine phosphatase [Methanomassiliicoccaceae archaeon]|nr:phosphoserine phosphatase [Methanomassiliicoccaceae archaeon]